MATAITTRKMKLTNRRILLVTAVICLAFFISITSSRGYFDVVNVAVNHWAVSIQTDGLTQLAEAAGFFDTTALLIIALPIAGFLAYKRQVKGGILIAGALALDVVILQAFKTFIVSPRPLNGLIVEGDYSFPSGHVTTTIVFLSMLTYLVWQNRSTLTKVCLSVLMPTAVILVGFDRIYLNAHWLSDVLAAPFLAIFVVAASILVVQQLERIYSRRRLNGSAEFGVALSVRVASLSGRAITPLSLQNYMQEAQETKKLTILKLAIISLYALFAALIAVGQIYGSNAVTISGLMAFTAAATLTTYYMVETQP